MVDGFGYNTTRCMYMSQQIHKYNLSFESFVLLPYNGCQNCSSTLLTDTKIMSRNVSYLGIIKKIVDINFSMVLQSPIHLPHTEIALSTLIPETKVWFLVSRHTFHSLFYQMHTYDEYANIERFCLQPA